VVNPSEELFETEVCTWLTEHGGYDAFKNDKEQGPDSDFDRATAIDRAELLHFISTTQLEEWTELIHRYGDDQNTTQLKFRERLAKEIESRGVVDVLRHGVTDHGVRLRMAYFKPAFGLSADLVSKYRANRVTVTRQLRYQEGSNNSVDLALFVNGLPVATAELKNPMTGQGIDEAITQYRNDRDPKVPALKRAVVHFAVDPQRVAMTTRLAGARTRFLPFNQGYKLGPGNPPNPDGHATAYLWQRVWEREAWLDLLARFVHVEKPGKGSKKPGAVIFPRFHQWDAVRRLEDAARTEGPGNNYLIQHSAGSGKSNTIAWLAHRLSTLHADDDTKVFDKVIVITDRVVLDRQLQETIYQFEHTHGVVERIERDSHQLARAVSGEQARIIITTLQKFPFVLDKIKELPARDYAVIIDEAHSSQSGDTAKVLRKVLGAKEPEKADSGDVGSAEVHDALAAEVAARGRQPNMSAFAFTATPKGKTENLFGRINPATGKHEPFHLYSMRQAIAEGFILDVLSSYLTYETYFHLEKAVKDDPRYQTAKARRSIAQFVNFHEHNLSQKASVVVDHFTTHVRHKVAGQAKAMVVCNSREHAVRWYLALEKYVAEHGHGVGVLVAFSGEVTIDNRKFTEAGCNGFPDTETAQRLDTDDFQVLVVAEKFQTGFDQPKLYAMYVDKTLTGLAAVQTLSRLNRTHPGKDGTFVLDFVNDAQAIAKEFETYHGMTVSPPTDPNLLYDTRHALDEFGIVNEAETEAFARLLLAEKVDHGRLHGALAHAIDRFLALEEDEQDRFRDALSRFVRTYSFLSQVVSFGDVNLERDYIFGKALAPFIKRDPGEAVDLSGAVELTHLRHERQFEGSVALDAEVGEAVTVYAGTGKQRDEDDEALSNIIERINAAHGTDWNEADRLVFDATLHDLVNDRDVQLMAVNNTEANFNDAFPKVFQSALLGRGDRNEKVIFRFLDDAKLARDVIRMYARMAQAGARVAYQEHQPIGELLGLPESASLELKATLTGGLNPPRSREFETKCIKSVAAFANSREGGTLLIGVNDDGEPCDGLEADYRRTGVVNRSDRDAFEQYWVNVLVDSIGPAAAASVSTQFHMVDGFDIVRVHAKPSPFPVEASVAVKDGARHRRTTKFYVRVGNTTRALEADEKQKYVVGRWSENGR